MKKLITTLTAAVFCCTLFSCTKELENTPSPAAAETAVNFEDSSNIKSNSQILNQEAVYAKVVQNIGGYLLHKPVGYKSSTEKYPLLISLAGTGNLGNGTTDLYKMAKNSVPALLQKGLFPSSFKAASGNFSFLVIAPQFKKQPTGSDVNAMINYALKKYRIDTSRIYVMGLSLGGGATADFASTYPKKAAAVVTMAESGSNNAERAKGIVKGNLPIWAFHNQLDPMVPSNNTITLINAIQSLSPSTPAKKTIFQGIKEHNCWTQATDPNYKESTLNIYEWMLQYKR